MDKDSKRFVNDKVAFNTEDKKKWLHHGEKKEFEFVRLMKAMGFNVKINPEKKTNPTKPDLFCETHGISDLKAQTCPFFKSSQYGIEPRYSFTLNKKDVVRYQKLYPNIVIYIWLDWQQNTIKFGNTKKSVDYLFGIYRISLKDLIKMIDSGKVGEHFYQRRQDTSTKGHALDGLIDANGNAKSSYVFDVRWFETIYVRSTPMAPLFKSA